MEFSINALNEMVVNFNGIELITMDRLKVTCVEVEIQVELFIRTILTL